MRLLTIPILFLCLSLHAQNFVWGHSPPSVAPGGIAIVSVTTNYLTTTGTSLTTTIPATTAGNCLVIICSAYKSLAVNTVATNSVSATFQITTNTTIGVVVGSTNLLEADFVKNIGAGITSVALTTVSASAGNAGFISVTIMEISGLSTTSPYTATERMASSPGGVGNVSTQDTGGGINNGTAISIFIGACMSNGASVIGSINATGTDGTWIEPPNSRNDGSIAQEFSTVYQIVSTSSSRKHVWNRVNNANGTTAMEFVLHQ